LKEQINDLEKKMIGPMVQLSTDLKMYLEVFGNTYRQMEQTTQKIETEVPKEPTYKVKVNYWNLPVELVNSFKEFLSNLSYLVIDDEATISMTCFVAVTTRINELGPQDLEKCDLPIVCRKETRTGYQSPIDDNLNGKLIEVVYSMKYEFLNVKVIEETIKKRLEETIKKRLEEETIKKKA